MATTHTFTLPKLVEAQDYHEFKAIEDTLRGVIGLDITVEEIGSADGWYFGLVYAGVRPGEDEIQALIKDTEIGSEDE